MNIFKWFKALSPLTLFSFFLFAFSASAVDACSSEIGQELEQVQLDPIVKKAGQILTILAAKNPPPAPTTDLEKLFTSKKLPKITFSEYLAQLKPLEEIEPSIYISALIYIDKFTQKTGIIINDYNVHLIFLASLTVAQKYLVDGGYLNSVMARFGRIKKEELNQLELDFFFTLGGDLNIEPGEYHRYLEELMAATFEEIVPKPKTKVAKRHRSPRAENNTINISPTKKNRL